MLALNTSNREDTNTHHNNTDRGIHNIDMDMHNMDMGIHNSDTDMHNTDRERNKSNKVLVVLDRHNRKENSAGSSSQPFFSLAIPFVFVKDSLFPLYSFFSANIKALDFTNQIFNFLTKQRMGLKSVDIGLNSESGLALQQIFEVV